MKVKFYSLVLFLSLCGAANAQTYKRAEVPMGTATVDGVLNDGYTMVELANSIDLTSASCEVVTPSTKNNTSHFGVMYDATNLYVGIEVIDDVVVQGDAVELFLGMLTDRVTNCPGNWPRAYGASDYQIVATLNEGATGVDITSPQALEAAVTASSFVKTATGYTVEMALAWSELDFFSGLTPDVNRVILFDVSNNDTETAGADKTSQLMWNANTTNRNWTENMNFGELLLTDIVANPNGTSTQNINNIVNSVSLVPNPAKENLTVSLNAVQGDVVSLSVVNAMSQAVISRTERVAIGSNNFDFNTSNLQNGMYYVVISNGKSNITQKLVISK